MFCQMNKRLLAALTLGVLASFICARSAAAATSNPTGAKTNAPAASGVPAEIPIPKSRFQSDLAGGKDPFYPGSARLQAKVPVARTNQVAAVVPEVKINGFSGNAARPLVIINNLTFGEGDEQMVTTAAGRAKVRCLAIRMEDQVVEIEINGLRRVLNFQERK